MKLFVCARNRLFRFAAAGLMSLLSACGGGGSGTAPAETGGSQLPEVRTETVPTGKRLDMRSLNFFAYGKGDNWSVQTYDANGRAIGLKFFSYEESSAADDLPQKAASIIYPFSEYPQPFYPVGGLRSVYRSGGWGEDIDGDKTEDGFKFTYSQIFRGTESFSISGRTITVAHFSNTSTFELIPSNKAVPSSVASHIEETWFAPGFNMVKRVDKTVDGDGKVIDPQITSVIYEATVSGRILSESLLDGTRISVPLEHKQLVFDPTRAQFIASLPPNATFGGGLARIDAATGAVLQTLPLQGEPGPMTISPDGQSLYVGLDATGELVKFRLDSMVELARTSLDSKPALSIAVSPVDADVVAVAVNWNLSYQMVLLRAMALQPETSYPGYFREVPQIVFDPTGTKVYSYNSTDPLSDDLAEFSVQGDGVGSGFNRPLLGPEGLQPVWFEGSKLVMGSQYFMPATGTFGQVTASNVDRCVHASTGRMLCVDRSSRPVDAGKPLARVLVIDVATGGVMAASNIAVVGTAFNEFTRPTAGQAGQMAMSLRNSFDRYFREIWLHQSEQLKP